MAWRSLARSVRSISKSWVKTGRCVASMVSARNTRPGQTTYTGSSIPADPTQCKGYVRSTGNVALTGNADFASLDGTYAVTIPANSSVMVYFAAEETYDANLPAASTGPIRLNVKTESFAP